MNYQIENLYISEMELEKRAERKMFYAGLAFVGMFLALLATI